MNNDESTTIACNDYQKCYYETISSNSSTGAISLCCGGKDSCYESTITGIQKIRCDSDSCLNTKITLSNNVYCTGYQTCNNMNADIKNNIICSGGESCQDTDINNCKYLYCTGYGSCSSTNIDSVENILFYGYKSGESSKITSGGNGVTMNIYFCGYLSEYEVSLYCSTNDVCIVYCASSDDCSSRNTPQCEGDCYNIYDKNITNQMCAINAPNLPS